MTTLNILNLSPTKSARISAILMLVLVLFMILSAFLGKWVSFSPLVYILTTLLIIAIAYNPFFGNPHINIGKLIIYENNVDIFLDDQLLHSINVKDGTLIKFIVKNYKGGIYLPLISFAQSDGNDNYIILTIDSKVVKYRFNIKDRNQYDRLIGMINIFEQIPGNNISSKISWFV